MNDKRDSVAPSTSYRWRSRSIMMDEEGLKRSGDSVDKRFLPSALRTASLATSNHLKRVGKMFSLDKTREVLRTALEDSEKVLYVRIACEHESLAKESKQLRSFVLELCERYETARSLDPIRRYKKMQSMAKTIVLQVRVNDGNSNSGTSNQQSTNGTPSPDSPNASFIVGDVLQSSVKQKEMRLKHEKFADSLENEQMHRDIGRLRLENEEMRTRIEALIDTINELDHIYNTIKNEPFVKRYAILKEAIKGVQKFSDPTFDSS